MARARTYLHRLDSLLAAGVLALFPAAGFTFALHELFQLSPLAGMLATLPPCTWVMYLIVHRDPLLPPKPAELAAMEDYVHYLRTLSPEAARQAVEKLPPARKPVHAPRQAL